MATKTPTNTQPEIEDFLEEDDAIRGQDFVLLSFISPEKVLQNKDRYFFNEFLKSYEISWKTKNLEKYLADTILGIRKTLFDEADRFENAGLQDAAAKCKDAAKQFRVEDVLESYKSYLFKNQKDINLTKINDEFDEFLYKNGEKLEDDFHRANSFHTTIRGVKIRGTFATRVEAEARAKKLQQKDKRHDILIGDVGKWLAWDPSPHQIPDQQYANEQLNNLMKAYNDNEDALDKFYTENPDAKTKKNEKSVFSMSLEPTAENAAATSSHAALFEGPADLALQKKIDAKVGPTNTLVGESVENTKPVAPTNTLVGESVENTNTLVNDPDSVEQSVRH